MRKIYVILCLLASLHVGAVTDTVQYRYRMSGAFVGAIPLGGLTANNAGVFPLSTATFTPAVSFSFAVSVYKNLSIGINSADIDYMLNKQKLATQIINRYSNPQYYTSISLLKNNFEVGSLSLELDYTLHTAFAEIEPYLLIGYGFGNADLFNNSIQVHRKKKNDNYDEDITPVIVNLSDFFYPGVGARANKKLYKKWYASAGLQYNYGMMHYGVQDNTLDYLGNASSGSVASIKQEVSSIQFHIGLQYRLHPIPAHKEEDAAQPLQQ